MGNRATLRSVLCRSRSARRCWSSSGWPLTPKEVVQTRSLLLTSFAALFAVHTAAAQNGPQTAPGAPLGEIRGRLTDSVAGQAIASGSMAVRRVGDSVFV